MGDPPSPAHRLALEVCALSSRTTEELLRAILVGHDATALFQWLRELPWMDSDRAGVFPRLIVKEAVSNDLRWRDPAGYASLFDRIYTYLLDRLREATGSAELDIAAGLIGLGATIFRDYLSGVGGVIEESLTPADHHAVVAMAEQMEGKASAQIVEFWLARQPEAFYAHRHAVTGELLGFMGWLRLSHEEPDEIAADPVVAAAWAHAREAGPVREEEHISLARFIIHARDYQVVSPTMDVTIYRTRVQWHRELKMAWSFFPVAHPDIWRPMMTHVDQREIPARPQVGDRTFTMFVHDWRTVPFDALLDFLKRQKVDPDRLSIDPPSAQLSILSREEFGAAVREALRSWHRPGKLEQNPLQRSRLVTASTATLRDVLTETIDTLQWDPREARLHRVLTAAFIERTTTQEQAAERLSLPMSTFRRHLRRAIDLLTERLWHQELHGGNRTGQPKPLQQSNH